MKDGLVGRAQLRRLPRGPGHIAFRLEVPGLSPAEAFQYWVDPEKLRQWWPPEAKVDPRTGGAYEFSWPKVGWRLRGHWVRFEPGNRLEFTWCWDHEPAVVKSVIVGFRAMTGGTEIIVEHGPYGSARRDRELREEHVQGWSHFLASLSALVRSG